MSDTSNLTAYGPVILRAALVGLFLWFGLSQVTNPGAWVSWVPQWALSLGVSGETVVLLNGGLEVVLGTAITVGFWTRLAAFLLSLHLFFIAYEIGYNDTGMRDLALATCTLSLALSGPDQFTLDHRLKKPTV